MQLELKADAVESALQQEGDDIRRVDLSEDGADEDGAFFRQAVPVDDLRRTLQVLRLPETNLTLSPWARYL